MEVTFSQTTPNGPLVKVLKKTPSLNRVITFFSVYSATSFFCAMKDSKIDRSLLNSVQFLCLSKNIATVVKKQKYQNVYWSKLPTKKSLLVSLKKIVKNQ